MEQTVPGGLVIAGGLWYHERIIFQKEFYAQKMKKTILVLFLVAVMLFSLSACGVSSSTTTTTTVSTSKTDADGNTTTNTIVNEIGVSAGTDGVQAKNETKSSVEFEENDEYSSNEVWLNTFAEGAEGVNDAGESFYFAYNNPDGITYGMLVMLSADGNECHVRDGEVYWDEELESTVLYDDDVDVLVPFEISDSDEENAFTMTFKGDGDVVTMYIVAQDIIINDIQNVLSQFQFD